MTLTFLLLAAAILSLWVPVPKAWPWRQVWVIPFAAAVFSGVLTGVLAGPAVLSLAVLTAMTLSAAHVRDPRWHALLSLGVATGALLLALHVLPGFQNPLLLDKVQASTGAPPITQYLNFDKGAAGLLLMAAFVPRSRTGREWRGAAAAGLAWGLGTAALVLALGWAAGVVRPDPKLPAWSAAFLATNLLFTCVAEEAFFRGLMQHRLADALAARGPGFVRWIPVLLVAVLFGGAHAAGGPGMALISTVAGIGYGAAFLQSGRIEAAILAHFLVNAVHFVAFTYPRLA